VLALSVGARNPFFAFMPPIRRVIYTTNAIESLKMQLRKIIKILGISQATTQTLGCNDSRCEM
jgi:transposase-like protein